jgi:hypothetical protein
MSSEDHAQERRRTVGVATSVLIAAVVAAGMVVRFQAATGDLWLDEVWSLELLRGLTSPVYIFSGIHHDNNHYLNSLYLYWLGFAEHFYSYRLLSLVLGLGSVLCAIAIGWRRGRLEALLAAVLFSSSFPLILYASEARGYAGLACFSLASFLAMQRYLDDSGKGSLVAFWLCASLGFLSHLTYAIAFAAIGIGFIARRWGSGASAVVCAGGLLRVFGVPTVVLGVLYWIDLRFLWTGGAAPADLLGTFLEAVAFAFWLPTGWTSNVVMGSLALAAGGVVVVGLRRRRDLEWVFYASVVSIAPMLGLAKVLLQGPQPFVMRHFLVPLTFLLLLVCFFLAELARRSRAGAGLAVLIVLLLAFSNSQVTTRLLKHGRDGYRQALLDMKARSTGANVFVGGDHEMQVDYLSSFYDRYTGDEKSVVLVRRRDWAERLPEWFIAHPMDPWKAPQKQLTVGAVRFELMGYYPSILYSGWPWAVYERVGR